jgi:hypothetical protein
MKIDNEPPIVMARCVLHNYCRFMGTYALEYDHVERMQDMRDKVQIASLVIKKLKLQR